MVVCLLATGRHLCPLQGSVIITEEECKGCMRQRKRQNYLILPLLRLKRSIQLFKRGCKQQLKVKLKKNVIKNSLKLTKSTSSSLPAAKMTLRQEELPRRDLDQLRPPERALEPAEVPAGCQSVLQVYRFCELPLLLSEPR